MTRRISATDFEFFAAVARASSLSAAGRELGISTAAVSKHLTHMEERLGIPLVNRTTRRMGLTAEGEVFRDCARRVVGEMQELEQALGRAKSTPTGLLRINATLGFGRSHVAALVSRFARRHPRIEVQLQLSVNPPPITDDAFDVCIRFGPPPDSRVVARLLAPNRRLLCAAPAYLERRGTPREPEDLAHHQCITIRQGDEAFGVWRLKRKAASGPSQPVKVRGALSTNDGGIAVNWALDGLGILLRAEWDIERHLKSGRLVLVLPNHETPNADIYAVYPQALQSAQRVRAFVEFLASEFTVRRPGSLPG